MKFKNIVILSGAGISQESGINTFRASDGLWENHRIEDVANPKGFITNPGLVHNFYNMRRAELQKDEIKPNLAHTAIAELQKNYAGNISVITQNVDDLHERAGTKNVLHMHGELLKMRCLNCESVMDIKTDIDTSTPCPSCGEKKSLRPDIVWFGETPYYLDEIEELLNNCDLYISIGTSGVVYPAAMFGRIAKENGATTVEVNLNTTEVSREFDYIYKGSATSEISKLIDDLIIPKEA